MNNSFTQFQIMDLRAQNQQKALETIVVGIVGLMSAALLPSLLLQYFYDVTTLTAEPAALKMIPLLSYGASALFFLYAVVGNMARGKKIAQLTNELTSLSNMPMGDSAAISDSELAELEAMVDDVLDSKDSKSVAAKKKTGRKSKPAKK